MILASQEALGVQSVERRRHGSTVVPPIFDAKLNMVLNVEFMCGLLLRRGMCRNIEQNGER